MSKIFSVAIPIIILFSANLILKSKHPIIKSFFSAASGVAYLLSFEIFSALTGLSLPLNFVTIGASAVFGLPGIATMLILNSVFK